MVAQKKWTEILSEIERLISILETHEDCILIINRFESIDEEYRDLIVPQFYNLMWKVALRAGKINLTTTYAKKYLDYLIDHKRIPHIKSYINSMKQAGLFKKSNDEFVIIEEILLGKRKEIGLKELKHIELCLDHPNHWKKAPHFLQQYLLFEEEWTSKQWKLCYEYILLNHFDKEIFLCLLEKARDLKKKESEKKFTDYLLSKRIKIRAIKTSENKAVKEVKENLHLDYDQVAMDQLSGLKVPSFDEQRRVLNSLKFISEEELLLKGQEMIVAFELLGMEQVVLALCEKMIEIQTETKERASTYYVWAQALSNNGDYYKTIDLIDDVIQKEPLLEDEQLALVYLKAEAYLKLNKSKIAKALYLEIKKKNPNYRLVGERLKTIETP